jgi:hypothetical protein
MEVWPSGFAVQAGIPNHRKLRRSRAGVVSVAVKGPLSAGQVCDEKTNVCEPLLTHRQIERWHQNRGSAESPGQGHAGSSAVLSARGLPACCPGGARCRGGVSSSWALAWNRRTCRLDSVSTGCQGVEPAGGREGGPRAANTASGRVPMRGTGAGRLVVVRKAL